MWVRRLRLNLEKVEPGPVRQAHPATDDEGPIAFVVLSLAAFITGVVAGLLLALAL
jgi:hypothetical protein